MRVSMEQTVKGVVDSAIFVNEQSGFGIFRIVLFNTNQKPLTIKGPISALELESFYEFTGTYREDPRFGMQFAVSAYKKMMPQDRDFIIRYLSGPNFPGVGQKSAEALVDKYGATILDDIRNNPGFVIECKGITQGKAEMIMEKVRYQDPIEDAVAFLIANGLGNKQIIKRI